MAGARALPDLVSRIRVDSSGVDAAISQLIGSFGKADLAMAGVAAGIGLLVIGGKSMIDIAEKHEQAERGLAQALATRTQASTALLGPTKDVAKYTDQVQAAARRLEEFDVSHKGHRLTASQLMQRQDLLGKVADATNKLAAAQAAADQVTTTSAINTGKFNAMLEDFLKTNRRYYSSQSELIDASAKLVRSGLSQDEVQKDLNRALDLAALKHISLSDATDLLNQAEHGRLRGLIDLGIATTKYTDANGNLINGSKDVGKAMGELDTKLKGGRDTLTDLQKDSNTLSNDWQDLSNKGGPVLLTLLDKVVTGVTAIYDWFDRIGKDDKLWATINDRLVTMAKWIHDNILEPLGVAGTEKLVTLKDRGADRGGQGIPAPVGTEKTIGKGARQFGGPVFPGRIYSVGETEEESLVMYPGGGGAVFPSGTGRRSSGGDTHNHFHQVMANPWDIANELAWAKKTKRL